MTSIKKKLSQYISISISVLLVSLFFIIDISVDSWISNQFDRAMINKAGLLETLVNEDPEKVDFDFADEFMPEFSGANDPEYFQLWRDNEVFERSNTLKLFENNDLPQLAVALHKSSITNITLPDGRTGRMYFTKFKPQIDSDVREEYGITKAVFAKTQKPMELAYATSNESLNQILWFVDVIFILTSISAVIAVRIIVFNVVERGLKPLDELNAELKKINLNSEVSTLSTSELPEELIAIADGINHFISENKILYSREKRITSDIAHELKTPIAELLNLSEVAIKFPHEKQLAASFKTDVLAITERLRNIVNGILLLQKSTYQAELEKQQVNVELLLKTIITSENKQNRNVTLNFNQQCGYIQTNEFAFTTVLTNLINNALYYSPETTPVIIAVTPEINTNRIRVEISNISSFQYSEEELTLFFEPLWQKDSSRTSEERYGLGLAIVKSYCDKIGAILNVAIAPDQSITFTMII
ncbi:sensor histidine kinase [Colwellia hornerae]|uniref:histidine kinase n=1 Tax=Colwellia hornerae TaxID=89402 RepID=A0A5C6QMR0_9GAMM|nr:HAMP domain-containing sensor histidine kinase [Colwellia hornerae]TWX54582.1 HAMP domain-containing histidine kinase [Colwellia hornerae]TWX61022.1 HAMP domain-containing histidine kinase [Colwellia hornerae]TWX70275.1 HAMP domain-containing histidine kinase [Colwellia hornerae]